MTSTLRARVAVASNAAFYGQSTVALPLTLAADGASKAQIALFFAVGAVVAAGLNLLGGPALRRRGSPWWGPSVCGVVAALGTLLVLATAPSPAMYLGGAAMMTMTLVFPHYLSVIGGRDVAGPARLVGRMRRVFVIGYLGGLALASAGGLLHSLDGDFQPLWIAAFLALIDGLIPLGDRRPAPAAAVPAPAGAGPGRRFRAGVTLLICVLAVLLLRAADAVRLVYLPLFMVDQGLSGTSVALLLLMSVAAEVPLLGPITTLADRIGSRRAIVLIAGVGLASFAVIPVVGGMVALIVSQLLYAVFAAGFQSVGMVLLSDVMDGGLGAGADVYTGMVQVGAVFGVAAPLLVPGYSARIFLLGAAFCLAAMVLLIAVRRRLPPVGVRATDGRRR
jgi:SET family sugar efflux transporter-like MFS transporter